MQSVPAVELCWRSATLLLLLPNNDVQYSIRTLAHCQAGCVDRVMAYRPEVDNDRRIEDLIIRHNRFEDSYQAMSSAEALKNRRSIQDLPGSFNLVFWP